MSDCTGLPSRSPEEKKISVDLAIVNGNIITVDDKNPHAEALAVKNERIVIVGSNSAIQETIGRNSTVIDAQGKTITPGFIDAHLHPIPLYDYKSIQHELQVGPAVVKTIDDLVAALARKAKITQRESGCGPIGMMRLQWVGIRLATTWTGRQPNTLFMLGTSAGILESLTRRPWQTPKLHAILLIPKGGHMIAIKMEN